MIDEEQDIAWRPSRGRTGLLVAAAGLVVAGGVIAILAATAADEPPPPAPAPGRVLVAVSVVQADGTRDAWWEGDGSLSRVFAKRAVGAWTPVGLDPVAPSPELSQATQDVDGADLGAVAGAAGARWIAAGEVALEDLGPIPIPRAEGRHKYAATFSLVLRDATASGQDAGAEPIFAPRHRYVFAASSDANALVDAAEYLTRAAALPLATAVATHPDVLRLRQAPGAPSGASSGLTAEEAALGRALDPVFRKVDVWTRGLEQREERLAEVRTRIAAGLPEGARAVSATGDKIFLIGVGADSAPLAYVEDHDVVALDPVDIEPRRADLDERVVRVDPETGAKTTLYQTYNIYSYPSVSADGRMIALVEDHFGYGKSLTAVPIGADGAPGPARHLLADETYFSTPLPSPRGRYVVYWRQQERRAPSSLEVIATTGDAQPRELVAADAYERMSLPSWAPDGEALYVAVETADAPTEIRRYAVADGSAQVLLGGPGREADDALGDEPAAWLLTSDFDRPLALPGGAHLVVQERSEDGARWLGAFGLEDGSYRRVIPVDAFSVVASPDSARVALVANQAAGEAGGGDDVAIISLADGAVVGAFGTRQNDRLPFFTRDGRALYWHHQAFGDEQQISVMPLPVAAPAP